MSNVNSVRTFQSLFKQVAIYCSSSDNVVELFILHHSIDWYWTACLIVNKVAHISSSILYTRYWQNSQICGILRQNPKFAVVGRIRKLCESSDGREKFAALITTASKIVQSLTDNEHN